MEQPKIKFQDKEYLLIDYDEKDGGAIATKESFENGECSFAHLFSNGEIQRFGKVIGKKEEIEFIGKENCEIGINALLGLFGDSWTGV